MLFCCNYQSFFGFFLYNRHTDMTVLLLTDSPPCLKVVVGVCCLD